MREQKIVVQNACYFMDMREMSAWQKCSFPIVINAKKDVSSIVENYRKPEYVREVLDTLIETGADIIGILEFQGPLDMFGEVELYFKLQGYSCHSTQRHVRPSGEFAGVFLASKKPSEKQEIVGLETAQVPAIGTGHLCVKQENSIYILSHLTRVPKNQIEALLAPIRRHPTHYDPTIAERYPDLMPNVFFGRDISTAKRNLNREVFENDFQKITQYIAKVLDEGCDVFWMGDLNILPEEMQARLEKLGLQGTLCSPDTPTWSVNLPFPKLSKALFSVEECVDQIWYFGKREVSTEGFTLPKLGSDHLGVGATVKFEK